LLGAYFSHEYSLEAAALFNPSIVPHPDQSDLPEGSLRFVLSLRATGEGHISSIVFRTGIIDKDAKITINPPTPFVTAADSYPSSSYDKKLFERKLLELGLLNSTSQNLLSELEDPFTFDHLRALVEMARRRTRNPSAEHREAMRGILALAMANYEVCFKPEQRFSERIITPYTPAERKESKTPDLWHFETMIRVSHTMPRIRRLMVRSFFPSCSKPRIFVTSRSVR